MSDETTDITMTCPSCMTECERIWHGPSYTEWTCPECPDETMVRILADIIATSG